jgi:hypothetical protein
VSGRAKRVPTSKPLPPFGRELSEARFRGEFPNVFIHAGDHAWNRAQKRAPPEVLCLPPDASADDYDWTIVKGLAVTLVVWDRDDEFVDTFARLLVIAGAKMVAALTNEGGSTFYRPRT